MKLGDFVKVADRIGVATQFSYKRGKIWVDFPDGSEDLVSTKSKVAHPKYAVTWTEDTDPMMYFTNYKSAKAFANKLAKEESVVQVSILKITEFIKGGK